MKGGVRGVSYYKENEKYMPLVGGAQMKTCMC